MNSEHNYNWLGRSLSNYVATNPKAKGAKNLTQARALAFGKKTKNYSCRCGNLTCGRANGSSSDSCNPGMKKHGGSAK